MLVFGGLSIADDLAEDSGRRLTLPPADTVLDEEAGDGQWRLNGHVERGEEDK